VDPDWYETAGPSAALRSAQDDTLDGALILDGASILDGALIIHHLRGNSPPRRQGWGLCIA
jgi:hypothetical protein